MAEAAVRDLRRCRADINADLLRAKKCLSKFLLPVFAALTI